MSDLQCPTTVIVARHGDAEYESDTWADQGGSLTSLGRSQAAELGQRLSGRRVAHIISSPLSRAVQTAEIAAAGLGVSVTIREDLREFGVGDFRGSRAKDPFAATYGEWLAGNLDARLPGAETGTELVARMREVVSEMIDQFRGETVLMISHGGLMRLTLPILVTQEPPRPPARIGNCAAVEVVADSTSWVCTTWPEPAPDGE